MIGASCGIDISRGIKTAPLWIRQDQAGVKMKLATGQPFDDEHGAGANRTAQLGSDSRMSCATFYAKQSTAACEPMAAPAVGKKAEVADADQALRQNVDQESA
jgi:hypothetical protein